MKRILVTLALVCMAICAYAQRDIPAGSSMEVASIESDESVGGVGQGKQITMYKVKDNDGNPSFLLSISNPTLTLTFGDSWLGIPSGGVLLNFGTTYDDVMNTLDSLLDLFDKENGTQMELISRDGEPVVCTLNKGALGKHLDIAETSLSKSNVKGLKHGLKFSKKLHKDL